MTAPVYLLFIAMITGVNAQCNNYSGTVCRPVIGSGPVFVDTSSEAAFADYKMNFTRLGVTVDATCEAFLRMQYCGLSTLSCADQARCGPYTESQIGVCGANACKCTGFGCSAGLRFSFGAIGGGLGYYVTGKQPQGTNCTEFNIPCPGSAALGLQISFLGVLVTAILTSAGMTVL